MKSVFQKKKHSSRVISFFFFMNELMTTDLPDQVAIIFPSGSSDSPTPASAEGASLSSFELVGLCDSFDRNPGHFVPFRRLIHWVS